MDETRPDADVTRQFAPDRPADATGADQVTAADQAARPAGRGRHSASSADDVTVRFGSGIPDGVADKWRHGRLGRSPVRRILGGSLTLSIALLAGFVVWWLLRGGGPALTVTGLNVHAPEATQRCGATAEVIGVIRTNGGRGTISYRWRRSDGQDSEVFTETVRKGRHSVRVPLRWTVQGTGRLHAVATLRILKPKGPIDTASGAFDYTCG